MNKQEITMVMRRMSRFKQYPANLLALTTIILFFAAPADLHGQDITTKIRLFSREEIYQDIRYLLNLIQDVHPDPYSGFGGRVPFQLEAQRVMNSIPEEGLTRQDLYNLLRPFFGKMGDGHSHIYNPGQQTGRTENLYLPVYFSVANDAIFISQAHKSYRDLIGYRLIEVNGKSLPELKDAVRNYFPAENIFTASRWLIRFLVSHRTIGLLVPDVKTEVHLLLLKPTGAEVRRSLPLSMPRNVWRSKDWISEQWDELPVNDMPFYSHFWIDRSTAYLRIKTVMAREAFEIMRANKRSDLDSRLESFYKNTLKKSKPGSLDDAITGVPSLTETVSLLLNEMKRLRMKHLIIDLKSNDGGWSEIAKPMFYMLFGDKFFSEDPVQFATRISEQYLELFQLDLKSLSKNDNTDYELGDLRTELLSTKKAAGERREEYISDLHGDNLSFLSFIENLDGIPLYTPEVYVISDPGTFSAAFDMMFHLWRMGAKIVGIPPSQSPKTFVDPSPCELPNTKLAVSISRTSVVYKGAPEVNRVFQIDYPMNWSDFHRYNFDRHSEVLYALDLIQGFFPEFGRSHSGFFLKEMIE
jgi:hypothetical protein